MSSHVVVIATDFKRATVKVNPGTYLTDVLEEACKKLGLPSSKYLLKNNKRQLDLSNTIRTSGLTPGAKLELVVKANTPSVITVALQLPSPESSLAPPNGRLTDKLSSEFTLWQILRQFEEKQSKEGRSLNITARGVPQTSNGGAASGSGQLYYETPVLLVEKRQFSNLVEFQKTLSQLGYNSGSVLVRLSFQRTEKTLLDAMNNIQEYFKEDPAPMKETNPTAGAGFKVQEAALAESSGDVATSATALASTQPETSQPPVIHEVEKTKTSDGVLSVTDSMDIDSRAPDNPPQPSHIFSAPASSTPAAAKLSSSEPDSTYQPTVAHAQAHQQLLLTKGQNKRLLSDREIADNEAAQAARIAAIKSVDVKVRFPDNTSAQWVFSPNDTGATLYKAVRSVMAHPDAKFKLALPGGKSAIQDEDKDATRLIKGYGLSGNTLVNLVWDDATSQQVRKLAFLKQSLVSKAEQVVVPEVPQAEPEDEKDIIKTTIKKESKPDGSEGSGGKKLPKWLKLGKK